MTLDELKAKYTVAYRIITRERAMRDRVFAAGLDEREAKMAEMDRLLEIIDDLKDELKWRIAMMDEEPASFEQSTLLDVARKAEYR